MSAASILSQFAATGVQSSFHGRHIKPQIMAGLDGGNCGSRTTRRAAATRRCARFWAKTAGPG